MTLADPPAGLSARLRTGTRSEHDRAQGSGFLDRLAAGTLPRAAYADLAAQHWFIYETLERAAAAMADHPVAGAFVFPELTRLPALTEDLTVLAGRAPHPGDDNGLPGAGRAPHPGDDNGLPRDGGQLGLPGDGAELVPLAATREYRARLQAVAFDKPWAFIAHHYTRYLGDLSGGQYLGPAIARAYGLDGAGHRFFVFEGVSPAEFRRRYRGLLDAAELSAEEAELLLAEVVEAYRLNIAVLTELKERWAS